MTSVREKVKLVIDLDPKVINDLNVIAEKFPCHDFVYGILLTFVSTSCHHSRFHIRICKKWFLTISERWIDRRFEWNNGKNLCLRNKSKCSTETGKRKKYNCWDHFSGNYLIYEIAKREFQWFIQFTKSNNSIKRNRWRY